MGLPFLQKVIAQKNLCRQQLKNTEEATPLCRREDFRIFLSGFWVAVL
jgi:hypothetical protein